MSIVSLLKDFRRVDWGEWGWERVEEIWKSWDSSINWKVDSRMFADLRAEFYSFQNFKYAQKRSAKRFRNLEWTIFLWWINDSRSKPRKDITFKTPKPISWNWPRRRWRNFRRRYCSSKIYQPIQLNDRRSFKINPSWRNHQQMEWKSSKTNFIQVLCISELKSHELCWINAKRGNIKLRWDATLNLDCQKSMDNLSLHYADTSTNTGKGWWK